MKELFCSGTKIEMSSSKDKSLTFLITAKPEQVLKAKRDVLVHFQTQANITINIPKEHHRFLLGKGGRVYKDIFVPPATGLSNILSSGSKLQELERATSTKISIPKVSLFQRFRYTQFTICNTHK